MTPAALLQRTAADGLLISVTPDRQIKINGSQEAIARWKPEITRQKWGLICALQYPPPDVRDFIFEVEERAAHLQFGCHRAAAESLETAFNETKEKWGFKP